MTEREPRAFPTGFLRLFVVFHESEALGAGRSVLHMLDHLSAQGWTTSGWFPGEGELVMEAAPTMATITGRPKPIRYSARGWRSRPGLVARLRDTPGYLREFEEALLRARPHVVHANTLRSIPEARIARRLGLPIVLQVHEMPEAGGKATFALRVAARIADVVVVVSEAAAEVVRPRAGKTPVLVAHNGVRPFSGSRRKTSSFLVGTVGTVCRTKGTDIFVEAAAIALRRRPGLRFEHIGQFGLDEDSEFERRVRALAAVADVNGALTMLGGRPAQEGLERWDVFVLTSRQDAFPLASLEAMSAGVPVIATRVGGLPEQIEHLRSGILVKPEDPAALADWIVRLHDDPGLRTSLAEEASRRVRDRFSVQQQGAALHKAYLAALNLRHGPPPVRKRTLEAV